MDMQSPTSASNGWAEAGEDFCPCLQWCERTFPFPLASEWLNCKVGNSVIVAARRSDHGEESSTTPGWSNSSTKAKCPFTVFLTQHFLQSSWTPAPSASLALLDSQLPPHLLQSLFIGNPTHPCDHPSASQFWTPSSAGHCVARCRWDAHVLQQAKS